MYDECDEIRLDQHHVLLAGRLPDGLIPEVAAFDRLWRLHPPEFHQIRMHGRLVNTPRWQQAYGRDYHYTSRTNAGLPIEPALTPFLHWANREIDARLDGLLLNWYDADLAHYIGKHRDSTTGMIEGAPIVTISLGEERVFRLRPWKAAGGFTDFVARNGTVFLMPYATNLAWTHEVPHRARDRGKRISVTLRAFVADAEATQRAFSPPAR